MAKKEWTTIRLDGDTKKALVKQAESEERSLASLISIILKDYVKEHKADA